MITEEAAKPQRNLVSPCLPGPNQWDSQSVGRLPIHRL